MDELSNLIIPIFFMSYSCLPYIQYGVCWFPPMLTGFVFIGVGGWVGARPNGSAPTQLPPLF